MPVDIEQRGAVWLGLHHMVVPNLVIEGTGVGHRGSPRNRVLSPLFNRSVRPGKANPAAVAKMTWAIRGRGFGLPDGRFSLIVAADFGEPHEIFARFSVPGDRDHRLQSRVRL